MYSTDFEKRRTIGIVVRKENRICQCCGHKIKKGTKFISKTQNVRSFAICIPCAGEAYYQVSQTPIAKIDETAHISEHLKTLLKEYSADRLIRTILAIVRSKNV